MQDKNLEKIPMGEYSIQGPWCDSLNISPQYAKPEDKILLFDFFELEKKTVTILEQTAIFLYQDTDCQLNFQRKIIKNERANPDDPLILLLSMQYNVKWEPENCELSILGDEEEKIIVKKNRSSFLELTEGEKKEDVPFEVVWQEAKKVYQLNLLYSGNNFLCKDESNIVFKWGAL